MLQSLSSKSIDELLQRIGVQPKGNIWTILVTDNLYLSDWIEELSETVGIFAECDVKVIFGQNGVLNLIKEVRESFEELVLIGSLENWNCNDWYQFDTARSQLHKPYGGILILSYNSAQLLSNCAPNFCSWVGSRFYQLDKDSEFLSDSERESRLSELREWSGHSDAEVIAFAKAHELPPTPEYGEWLVLLGRGNLIGR